MGGQKAISLRLRGLELGYKDRVLCQGVDLDFKAGSLTAIIGRNGTGKSTLLRCLSGIDRPSKGQVLVGSQDDFCQVNSLSVNRRARILSFVSTERINLAGLKVETVVGFGLAPYTDIFGRLDDEHRRLVAECLDLVSMGDFATKSMDTLSDGERQRVMIARAVAQQTPIIILDEPTAFLDLPNKYEISHLLYRLVHQMNKTIIFTTHDLDVALELCDRFVVLENSTIVEGSLQEIVEGQSIDRMLGESTKYLGKGYFDLKNKAKEL